MTDRQLRRYSGEDQVQQADLTDFVKWPEAEFGARAYNGEATDSTVTLRDETGRFGNQDDLPAAAGTPISLASRNVARYIHGSNILWQGRIVRKDYTRDGQKADRAREVNLYMEDVNTDLRGVVVNNFPRPAETDVARIQGIVAHYLSGVPSPTRKLNGSNFISASNTVSLPAQTYTRTDVQSVLSEIAATANKNFWVWSPRNTSDAATTTGTLVYDGHEAVVEQCPFRITDREDEVRANPRYWFPPIWNVGPAETENGQEMLSGVWVYFTNEDGDADHVHVENPTVAAIYSHYEIAYSAAENVRTQAQATTIGESLLSYRQNEERTNNVTIGPLDDTQIGSIRVGQTISVKFRASPSADDGYKARRITQLKFTSPVPGTFFVHLMLDRPVRFRAYGFGNSTPTPPVQPPGDTCTRYYLGDTSPGGVLAADATWETSSTGGGFSNANGLFTTPEGASNGQLTWSAVGASAGEYVTKQYQKVLNSTEAAVLAAGGASLRLQMKCRSRYGLGVSEAAQDNYLTVGVRVYRPGTASFVGTALTPGSAVGAVKFVAEATTVNRSVTATLAAVGGTVATDIVVVEIGTHHVGPTSGATGSSIIQTDNQTDDLPEDNSSTATQNAWIDICTGGGGGDSTNPIVNPGEESAGSGGVYAPINHTHAHGMLDPDGLHMHAEYQVHQMVTNDGSDPTVTDDADAGYSRGWHWHNTTTGDVFYLRDSTTGAADWVLIAPESGGSGMTNPMTTRGDMIRGDAAGPGDPERFAIGTAGYHLVARTDPTWEAERVTLNFIIDGGGSAITTGVKGDVVVDFAAAIESVTLLADQSGSIVVDIWKDTYTNYPPVVGDSITAAAKPTITTATKSQDTTLTGWTTSITAGDTLRFNVDSITTCTRVVLALKLRRT